MLEQNKKQATLGPGKVNTRNEVLQFPRPFVLNPQAIC